VLQALRRMKLEDIYGRWQARRLSQGYAAATVPPKRFSTHPRGGLNGYDIPVPASEPGGS
jgi:hypothetical protein